MSRLALLPLSLLLILGVLPQRPSTAGKLADDGRAATVMEVQGTALVRPAGRERWTPLGPKSVLFPGDVLRTAVRGAHALELRTDSGNLLIGPGALVELPTGGGVRLLRGEMEAGGSESGPLAVRGPGGFARDIKGTSWLRTKEGAVEVLEKTPRWIEGYRSSSSNEWMGSLLANVDGREVPLAVGYHKVDAEIRDQIARTTVEQSFINTTSSRLEGVFYFPLPAGASISGFGMWIGNELVEADIVERQRARQIYEDILRRKKDPGLLEWEGGNLFKARVFPIEAHSEKRIRIRYTQVLPLKGSTMRYRYALRSELLRSKPLRELQLTVRVVSETPMHEVACPTHDVLSNALPHEATVEFKASEYRPDKDFEVAVRLRQGAELTAVPHRRGDDGYFMLLIAPPDEEAGSWKRDLVPDGDPLHLVLLADTSGSMDAGARSAQADFLAGLLGVLSEQDRVRLAACDATVEWLTPAPQAPAAAEAALDRLAARPSLGWTDIHLALRSALEDAPEGALVIYVGDGVGTTGDADPIALAERIDALGKNSKVSVHAVAPSSSYEAPVLNAMARIGGGSVREVGDKAVQSAFALLAEAARPALRDIRLEIQGIRTARVYPQRLPNLALGFQQVVLGRYLPTDEAQSGRVVVTGTRAGKPVRFTAELTVPAGDAGNSFLPRLWGRRHIDALLEQGSSPAVQEEIVSFSERFGIMTPYTSFLVLESDEDREKYGVARRVRMRDGERFFADARDRATLAKRRELMQAAGRWRLEMRRNALLEIARLGRDLPIHTPPSESTIQVAYAFDESFGQSEGLVHSIDGYGDTGVDFRGLGRARGGWGGRPSAGGGERMELESAAAAPSMRMPADPSAAPPPTSPAPSPRMARKGKKSGEPAIDETPLEESVEDLDEAVAEDKSSYNPRFDMRGRIGRTPVSAGLVSHERLSYGGRRWQPPPFQLGTLGFPVLPPPPKPPEGDPGEPWNEEVETLLRSLIRRDHVRQVEGGLRFELRNESLHGTRGTTLAANRIEGWIGASAWRLRSEAGGSREPREHWLHDGTLGALAVARRLARTRDAEDADANAWWLPIWDLQTRDLIRAWKRQGWRARIVAKDAAKVTIALEMPPPDKRRVELVVDLGKRILFRRADYDRHGKISSRTEYGRHVEVAGRWWAQLVERFDGDGDRVGRTQITIEALAAGALETEAARARSGQADVITVHGKLPEVHEAKQAIREKRAAFVDHVVVAVRHGQRQQWDPGLAAWNAAAALVADKPGRRWIHGEFLSRARVGPVYKAHVEEMLAHVGTEPGPATRFRAHLLHGRSIAVLGPTERGALLEALKERWIDASSPGADRRREQWMHTRASAYTQAKRHRAARRLYGEAAQAFPYSIGAQLLHATNNLAASGRVDEAVAHLEMLLAEREPWLDAERDGIYLRLTDHLWQRRRFDDLQEKLAAWIEHAPKQGQPWQRWFSIPYYRGDEKTADAQILAALQSRPQDGAPEHEWARLTMAVDVALGQGWNFHLDRIEAPFHEPLAALCGYLWRDVERVNTPVTRIFGDWRFRRTDAHRALAAALRADVAAEGAVEAMPVDRLGRYVRRLGWGRNQVEEPEWRALVDRIRARWTATADKDDRGRLGDLVLVLLDAQQRREEAIAFARERLRSGEAPVHAARARDLFARLLTTPVRDEHQTPEREDELIELLPHLLDPKAPFETQRAEIARRARTLASTLYSWRYEKGIGTPEERKPLSRAALKTLRKEARQSARTWLAERLGRAEEASDERHKPWLQLERLGYAVEAGEGLEAIVAEAAGILQRDWKREDVPLDRLVRERAAVILAYAATRRNAAEALKDTVLETLRTGETAEPEPKDDDTVELLDWRQHIYRLLVALDRAPALEAVLRAWIVPAQVQSRWRLALGYLLAETGRLDEAASQLEEVHGLGELGAHDYLVLADWYLVLGLDEKRDRALDARYDHMNEYQLSSLAWQLQRRMGRRTAGVPGDFDPEVVRVLRALMRKAQRPGNYWSRIRNVYRPTKDFRTLEPVTDALVGHTKEGVYPFLGTLTQLLREVHEEATLDALRERLDSVRGKSEVALDRRALYLATSLVEGRAAEVLEKDTAHGGRALAALRAAFQEDWQDGERGLMAGFLRGLGRVRDDAVGTEQLRQLEALRAATREGTLEHLHIAHALAATQWAYGDREGALAVIAGAITSTRAAHEGRVPLDARVPFDAFANWLSDVGRFRDAEREIQTEIDRAEIPYRRRQLVRFLYEHYVKALWAGGSTSLGSKTDLFTAVRDAIAATMRDDPAQLGEVLRVFLDLHKRAQERRVPHDAGERLIAFARERFPPIFARVPMAAASHAETTGRMIRELRGPRAGLAFLLDHHDAGPRWLGRMNRTVWQECNRDMARWRHEAGGLGSLEPRLFALVDGQLDRNLTFGGHAGSYFWSSGNKWFWGARAADFAATAERVAEIGMRSEAVVRRCAEFLHSRLGFGARGIALFAAAHERGLLSLGSRWTLASWLYRARRFADALPMTQTLIEERPDQLRYRLHLTKLLAGLGRTDEATKVLDTAEAHFRDRKRWNEGVAASLGRRAAELRSPERAVRLMDEAIGLRQEARGHRGGNDWTLAGYYAVLARGRGQLGNTSEAVRAAASSILMTGTQNRGRHETAVKLLDRILADAKSLPAYVETYEAQVLKEGLDAPILRKAFARAFERRGDTKEALRHLLVARDLDALDAAIHTAIVAAYDALGDAAGARTALFGSIRLAPHNYDAYKDLAQRYRKSGDNTSAERALTTLAEMAPHQPGGHRALATMREKQDRWDDAVVQWRQVTRTDALDPTGWIALAEALMKYTPGSPAAAREALDHVLAGTWEERFGDVKGKAAALRAKLP